MFIIHIVGTKNNNTVVLSTGDLTLHSFNCQGGISEGYKTYIAQKEIPDDTYNENGVALFRIQGSGPDNMQAIQVEPVCPDFSLYMPICSFCIGQQHTMYKFFC